VVDVQKITVQINMLIPSNLDCGIGRDGGRGAWWEVKAGEQAEGRQRDLGDALGGKLLSITSDNDLLDVGMRGLHPMRLNGSHCDVCDDG